MDDIIWQTKSLDKKSVLTSVTNFIASDGHR